jgi:hypothetical protein
MELLIQEEKREIVCTCPTLVGVIIVLIVSIWLLALKEYHFMLSADILSLKQVLFPNIIALLHRLPCAKRPVAAINTIDRVASSFFIFLE